MQIDLADQLHFQKTSSAGLTLTCDQPELPVDESNLCYRAYQLIREAAAKPLNVSLHLEKKIPAGAGLGGGSSDAAVTLMALNRFFELDLPIDRLLQLATELGSDVPFFLTGGMCRGRGRGEILEPIDDLPAFWVLLVTPPVAVSTAWAYQNYNKLGLTKTEKYRKLPSSNILHFSGVELLEVCQNDLEAAVFEKYEELAKIKAQLQNSGAMVSSMTGSGSAMFGLFRTRQEAQEQTKIFESSSTFVAKPIRWGIQQVYQMQY